VNVGLPGTGIGGLFYLLAALLLPLLELRRTVRGRSSLRRWGLVIRQATIALGIIVVVWATTWIGGQVLSVGLSPKLMAGGHVRIVGRRTPNALQAAPTALTLLTLGGVVLGIELAAYRRKQRPPTAAGNRRPPMGATPPCTCWDRLQRIPTTRHLIRRS